MSDLAYLDAARLGAGYRSKELSPVEVTRAALERIASLEPKLHAFFTVTAESALEDARRAERELAAGRDRGPWHGVPVGIKDLCDTAGVRTTAGTRVRAEQIPTRDAAVVARLREAGAVLLGKLAMTEGAFIEHHPDYEAPVNPWDAERWTGVSSSGSAVAVAAGLCSGALGSDTGGSIRFPSACCGVVGLKPTYGRVPLSGVFPLALSLDHVGPMTRTAADAATLLGVLAGHDAGDPGSLRAPVPDYAADLERGIAGVRIGLDERYALEGTSEDVAAALREALEVLRGLGAEIVPVRMPEWLELARSWLLVCASEVAVAHRDTFPARADDYGPALRALLEGAPARSAVELAAALELRRAYSGELRGVLEQVDLVACPSVATPAPPLALIRAAAADGGDTSAFMKYTAPFDFSGSPTLSVPCGASAEGLPLSLQLVGRHLDEALLCRAGHAYQGVTTWHTRRPPL